MERSCAKVWIRVSELPEHPKVWQLLQFTRTASDTPWHLLQGLHAIRSQRGRISRLARGCCPWPRESKQIKASTQVWIRKWGQKAELRKAGAKVGLQRLSDWESNVGWKLTQTFNDEDTVVGEERSRKEGLPDGVTHHPGLSGAFSVFALHVLHTGRPRRPGKAGAAAYPTAVESRTNTRRFPSKRRPTVKKTINGYRRFERGCQRRARASRMLLRVVF